MAREQPVRMQFVGGAMVPAPEPEGFIYFIEADGAKRIKIGWTDQHPHKRLANLQTGSCFPLKPMGVMIGPYSLEAQTHCRFSALRCGGEWFRDHARLRAFIEKSARPWPTPDQRIIRPATYSVKQREVCVTPFDCHRCHAPVREGDRWFACESIQGDKACVCYGCVRFPDINALRGAVKITKLTYGSPTP